MSESAAKSADISAEELGGRWWWWWRRGGSLVPMPTADCRFLHHGRIMRCLTYLLLLPETLKKSRKVGRLPPCSELLALSLTSKKKQKMAAELYPAANANNTNLSSGTTVADTDKTEEVPVKPAGGGGGGAATTPTTQQNITNNNVDPPSWQCSHPTLRERYTGRGGVTVFKVVLGRVINIRGGSGWSPHSRILLCLQERLDV